MRQMFVNKVKEAEVELKEKEKEVKMITSFLFHLCLVDFQSLTVSFSSNYQAPREV